MTDSGTFSRDQPVGLGGRSPRADPSVAAPAGVALSGPDVLLATKLHVPRPQPGFVPRRRLVHATNRRIQAQLVIGAEIGHLSGYVAW